MIHAELPLSRGAWPRWSGALDRERTRALDHAARNCGSITATICTSESSPEVTHWTAGIAHCAR